MRSCRIYFYGLVNISDNDKFIQFVIFGAMWEVHGEPPCLILERKALIGGISHVIQMWRGDWPKVRYCSTDSEIEWVKYLPLIISLNIMLIVLNRLEKRWKFRISNVIQILTIFLCCLIGTLWTSASKSRGLVSVCRSNEWYDVTIYKGL